MIVISPSATFFSSAKSASTRRIDELPVGAVVGERDGLDGVLGRMQHDAADVGTRVLGDHGSACSVFRSSVVKAAGVAIAAVDQVQHVAGLVEADRIRWSACRPWES